MSDVNCTDCTLHTVRVPQLGDQVFVLSKLQASNVGAYSPRNIYPAIVTQVFEGMEYVNVTAFSGQPVRTGGQAFWVGSVVPVSATDQTDNVYSYDAEELANV